MKIIKDILEINQMVRDGSIAEYIVEYEYEFDRKILRLAAWIAGNVKKHKIILISGPSSSGKTTTTLKLAKALLDCKVNAVTVSLDDFFLDRDKMPRKENGEYDFESVHGLDLDLIGTCFNEIITQNYTMLPSFNFKCGRRQEEMRPIVASENTVVLAEGIHALNDLVVERIPSESSTKMYFAMRSNMKLDDKILFDKRDLRLVRRLVRDYNYRGSSPSNTLKMWVDVLAGDLLYVRPYADRADETVDTFFPYDVGILRDEAVKLLRRVKRDSRHYVKARSLLEKLRFVEPVALEFLPKSSVVREFSGGSIYY